MGRRDRRELAEPGGAPARRTALASSSSGPVCAPYPLRAMGGHAQGPAGEGRGSAAARRHGLAGGLQRSCAASRERSPAEALVEAAAARPSSLPLRVLLVFPTRFARWGCTGSIRRGRGEGWRLRAGAGLAGGFTAVAVRPPSTLGRGRDVPNPCHDRGAVARSNPRVISVLHALLRQCAAVSTGLRSGHRLASRLAALGIVPRHQRSGEQVGLALCTP